MATTEEVVAFTIASLQEMNLEVDSVTPESVIGPAGVDLDSLAVSELTFRIEDRYGVRFPEDEMDRLAVMTLAQFAEVVAGRAAVAAGA